MKISEIDKSYQPPTIEVGDEVKIGKFKNRKAEVKGFTKDKNNQPVLKTDKGDQQLFKPRISKLVDPVQEAEGEPDIYEVVDSRTKEVVCTRPTLKSASRRADKLDLEYGAVRYIVRRKKSQNT